MDSSENWQSTIEKLRSIAIPSGFSTMDGSGTLSSILMKVRADAAEKISVPLDVEIPGTLALALDITARAVGMDRQTAIINALREYTSKLVDRYNPIEPPPHVHGQAGRRK